MAVPDVSSVFMESEMISIVLVFKKNKRRDLVDVILERYVSAPTLCDELLNQLNCEASV